MTKTWIDRAKKLARSPRGLWALFVGSVLETTIVPVPFEAVMLPMMLADRERVWKIACVAYLGCLLGAVIGYGVGALLFQAVGLPLLSALDAMDAFHTFQNRLDQKGFWIVFMVGFTPVPFQVATVGSGVSNYAFLWFCIAVASSRSIRYFGMAAAVYVFGARVQTALSRYRWAWPVVGTIAVIALVAYAVWALIWA